MFVADGTDGPPTGSGPGHVPTRTLEGTLEARASICHMRMGQVGGKLGLKIDQQFMQKRHHNAKNRSKLVRTPPGIATFPPPLLTTLCSQFGSQHGSQKRILMVQKSIQKSFKIGINFMIYFFFDFGSILDGFWVVLDRLLAPKASHCPGPLPLQLRLRSIFVSGAHLGSILDRFV